MFKKEHVKLFLLVGVSFALWNTIVRRVPVVGPMVNRVLQGL